MKSSVAQKTTAQEKCCLVCETNDCRIIEASTERQPWVCFHVFEESYDLSVMKPGLLIEGLNIIPKYLICQKLKKNNLSDFRVGWDLLQDPGEYVCDSCWGVQGSLLRLISAMGKKRQLLRFWVNLTLRKVRELASSILGERAAHAHSLEVYQGTAVLHSASDTFLALR